MGLNEVAVSAKVALILRTLCIHQCERDTALLQLLQAIHHVVESSECHRVQRIHRLALALHLLSRACTSIAPGPGQGRPAVHCSIPKLCHDIMQKLGDQGLALPLMALLDGAKNLGFLA